MMMNCTEMATLCHDIGFEYTPLSSKIISGAYICNYPAGNCLHKQIQIVAIALWRVGNQQFVS